MKPIRLLFFVLLFASVLTAQKTASASRTLLETKDHIVTVSVKDGSVEFMMEAIADFEQDRDDTKPLGFGWDFAGIRVDMNNNKEVDKGIDIAFGIRQGTKLFCSQYLISETASSACGGHRSKGNLRVEFMGTRAQARPHPVFIYTIPISELRTYGLTIGLAFEFFDPVTRKAFYPSRRRGFYETIPLNLSGL